MALLWSSAAGRHLTPITVATDEGQEALRRALGTGAGTATHVDAGEGTGGLTWVHVTPDTPEELTPLLEICGLPAGLTAHLLRDRHHGGGGVLADGVLVPLGLLRFEPATAGVEVDRLACLCVPGLAITVGRDGEVVHEVLQALPGEAAQGSLGVLTAAATVAGRRAVDAEIGLADAVASVEQAVFGAGSADPAQVIYRLKRELAEARRALTPMVTRLGAFDDEDLPPTLGKVSRRTLHRLAAALRRTADQVDGQDRLLSDLLTVLLTLVQVRQNADMRRMAAWAALIAVPTMVAGVYGMNFRHMPELSWPYGYPAVLAVLVVAVLVLRRLFKRSGWM
ncbi:CorA family divalent cation transporter [Georgenia thermotolerans]|uniref:Magnesium and cobalt transport protein CorA n=1 Tax=Georgenia thermotolerans TaxID=527326 RepID=A0A7J5UR63_9MICO|nr:CorA family divalent cation transporter [Georgenia thermotolerans]KAE8764700.1 magnesium and cobalt transport protein CorA [Georgenia thermotolerans]